MIVIGVQEAACEVFVCSRHLNRDLGAKSGYANDYCIRSDGLFQEIPGVDKYGRPKTLETKVALGTRFCIPSLLLFPTDPDRAG